MSQPIRNGILALQWFNVQQIGQRNPFLIKMSPMLAIKASPTFLGNSSPFRARRGQPVPARMRHMAAQAYAITLKMPDGEKTIDVDGEHSRALV